MACVLTCKTEAMPAMQTCSKKQIHYLMNKKHSIKVLSSKLVRYEMRLSPEQTNVQSPCFIFIWPHTFKKQTYTRKVPKHREVEGQKTRGLWAERIS